MAATSAKLRPDIHIHVGQRAEQFAEAPKIVPVKSEVCGNEIRARVSCKQMIALGHQRFKWRIPRGWASSLGEFLQFEPTLVVLIPWIEKRRRLGNVNEHRDFQLGAFFKKVIEAGIV